jgi:negative regulator of sigma E activity
MTWREKFDVRWGSCEGNFRTIASFRRVLGSMSERNVAKVGVSDGGNLSVWISMVGSDFGGETHSLANP